MRSSLHINKYRIHHGQLASADQDGMNGAFQIPTPVGKMTLAMCLVCDGVGPGLAAEGLDWEHVSIHMRDMSRPIKDQQRTPTWVEMCWLKELFWNQDEEVIQVHPKKSDYVNIHLHVLHLWRPVDGKLRLPSKTMV
jgi:hypothetical protein